MRFFQLQENSFVIKLRVSLKTPFAKCEWDRILRYNKRVDKKVLLRGSVAWVLYIECDSAGANLKSLFLFVSALTFHSVLRI